MSVPRVFGLPLFTTSQTPTRQLKITSGIIPILKSTMACKIWIHGKSLWKPNTIAFFLLVEKFFLPWLSQPIKHDGEGNPVWAKYWIVLALGNLDPPHDYWTKTDCFTPHVLSQVELRLLVSSATSVNQKMKSCDVSSQAFCQFYLPDNEKYVCRPPHGCPLTSNKETYLKLKKTIYGLKQSPHHWSNQMCIDSKGIRFVCTMPQCSVHLHWYSHQMWSTSYPRNDVRWQSSLSQWIRSRCSSGS